jgi:Na+/H+ antiporter NhaD/arsenite permease-like protein
MTLAHISLLGIVIAITIGFVMKVNTGLVSLAFAFVIGNIFAGIGANQIIGYWPTRLFFILFGVTLVFSIAKENKTMEKLARKAVYLSGGNVKVIPWIFFLLSLGLAAIGPGNISIAALLGPIAMAVASETKINPSLMAGVMICGAVAGGLSPIAPTGIIGVELAAEIGLDTGMFVWIRQIAATTIYAAIVFTILGGFKMKKSEGFVNQEKPEAFDQKQLITLGGIALLVIAVIIGNYNIGLAAFTVATLLLLLKVAPQKTSLGGVPWGTLLLVSGTGVLISVSSELGGLVVLTEFLSQFMTAGTAPAFIAVISGIMSFFSSASGVVMPTMIRSAPDLVASLGGGSVPSLIAAIVIGSHLVTPSPISTMGALLFAGATEEMDKQKIFRDLLIIAIGGVAFAAVFSLIVL